ncbi:MAG: hypothetical protein EBZ77_16990 [Chitinophagia bacterium]|nr:hypothetical protein [Chitinophagia bacterium]
MGSSAYQLPHYIFVAFPLAAIATAASIAGWLKDGKLKGVYKVLIPFTYGITGLVLCLVLYLITVIFPSGWLAMALWLAGVSVWVFLAIRRPLQGRFVVLAATAMTVANLLLGGFVYYALLQYQAGSQVGRYLKEHRIPQHDCTVFKMRDPMNALSFYSGVNYGFTDTIVHVPATGYVLTMDEGLADLRQAGYRFNVIRQDSLFKVSELTAEFLNPKTRGNAVKPYYLLHILPKN